MSIISKSFITLLYWNIDSGLPHNGQKHSFMDEAGLPCRQLLWSSTPPKFPKAPGFLHDSCFMVIWLTAKVIEEYSFSAEVGSWLAQRLGKNTFPSSVWHGASFLSHIRAADFTQMLQEVFFGLFCPTEPQSKLGVRLRFLHFIAGDKDNVFPSHLLLSAAETQSPEAYMDTGQVYPTQCRFLLGDELI